MATNFIDKLRSDITSTRKIRETSLKSYVSTILNLHKRVIGNKEMNSLKFLEDRDKVMGEVGKLKKNTQKNLSCISCCMFNV